MTEERYTPGSGDETDALVSARYRDLARERAPEHLDRAVLQEAARAARPRYSKLRSWTRPLAWAATVMLSVVLVLEISQLPAPDEAVFDVPSGDGAPGSTGSSAAEAEALEDSVPATAAPARSFVDQPAAAPAAAAERVAAPQLEPAADLEKRQRSIPAAQQQEQPDAAGRSLQSEAQLEQLRPKEVDMLQRAEEMARNQAGDSKDSAPQPETSDAMSVTAFGAAADRFDAAACDEQVRMSPQTWLECIEGLEAAGLTDQARLERERLQQTFPEFELP